MHFCWNLERNWLNIRQNEKHFELMLYRKICSIYGFTALTSGIEGSKMLYALYKTIFPGSVIALPVYFTASLSVM
jgi:hypothetical protein